MSPPTRAVLFYLRRYLEENPAEKKKLLAEHFTKTKRTLNTGSLSRHLNLKIEPTFSTGLVYLSFLHKRGELIPAEKGAGLFFYAHPELLKK